MKLDGKRIADDMLTHLAGHMAELKNSGLIPTLAVILVGDDPASLAYIKQKQNAAERIGARVVFNHQPATITSGHLKELIAFYNNDPGIDGLIVQRPVPKTLGEVSDILASVRKEKDVDGFVTNSPFDVPVAAAIGEILKTIHRQTPQAAPYTDWLKEKHIVIIGRGETAGVPIHRYLEKLHCRTSVTHSQTPHPEVVMKHADIIISCVGKERVVTKEQIKPGAIVISVGIWRDELGKLRGDYDETDIADTVSWYSPTPGGVGPINVACLMQNLLKACMMKKGGTYYE